MIILDSLSIFFPAYNDASTIGFLVDEAYRVGGTIAHDLEVIVVDDGSHDATPQLLRELQVRHPQLRIITHPANRGYGAALASGFAAATGEFVFYTDGDGQYSMADLPKLATALDGFDVVNGYKQRRADPWYRIFCGNAYCRVVTVVFSLPVRDVNCDFRLIRRALLAASRLSCRSGAIGLELIMQLRQAGARFAEVPVTHLPRRYGSSQFFTLHRVAATLGELVRLWMRTWQK